jgi:CheY-like chemotaxis protein
MPRGGKLTIEASDVDLDESRVTSDPETRPGTYVSITIRDTGVGIPKEVLARVFDPFFTTKEIGKGTGLGLSMAYGFAKQSGGQIAIESALDEGTEVRLYLPATDERALELVDDQGVDLPIGRGERVMLVEDEAALRKFVVTLLEELGYAVVAVADGEQALAALDEAESLDLLLSDVVLPGNLSGPQLAKQIETKRPEIKVLFMSGYAEAIRSEEGPLWPNHELLKKPFRKAELAWAVRATIDGQRSTTSR